MRPSLTFRDHKQRDDRITTALERGRAEAEQRISKSLFEVAMDTKHKGQVTACIWLEKTRFGRVEPKADSGANAQEASEALERFKAIISTLEERARLESRMIEDGTSAAL